MSAQRSGNSLGQSIAQARHQLEAEVGLKTLDMPLSRVCDSCPFRHFFFHLATNVHRLRRLYNHAIDEYRAVHRMRSASHPVPKLSRVDDWLESPFWIWTSDDPRRRQLFVRQTRDEIQLSGKVASFSDSSTETYRLSMCNNGESAVHQLQELRSQGVKIRPRAMMTTMYLRLFLSDLFVHGIGGAKYDQLTDALIERFWGIRPPEYLTVSATFHLVPNHQPITNDDVRDVDAKLRELWFHPEIYLSHCHDNQEVTGDLVETKRRWVTTELPLGQRLDRHRGIEHCNKLLRQYVEKQRSQLEEERLRLRQLARTDSVLTSREHAFCLFPADLPNHLLALSRRSFD